MQEYNYKDALSQIIRGVKYIIQTSLNSVTKNYNGVLIKPSIKEGYYIVEFNGEKHDIPQYGTGSVETGKIVKVFVPENNMSLAYFI